GAVNSGDSTLHVAGSLSNPTRLAYIQNCTAEANGGGPGGHGHINASIAGGYDSRTGAAYNDADGFNLGLGINPYGRLAGTRVFGETYNISACGNSDTGVIQASYNAGARISSNSWGCSTAECVGMYDASSQAYDVGTRDAVLGQAGNQQLAFVFAAGNTGPNSATIGSPGNAKNVITVGASENDRPTWTDGCLIGPSGANNAMDIIGFSSRGPASGGRVKPEVVAPGTHVQGTASTSTGYTGVSVCDKYHPLNQTVFAASSGTSHSTPAVAGVASLYYHWLAKNYGLAAPSPAILKAYLIAHPTYLTGASANDTLPSNKQGFGMPNLGIAFDGAPRYLLDQTVAFNNSGETWTLNGGVGDATKPVRIVLAYTDQAGAVGTSPQVNDLNLSVQIGGQTYLGNRFSGAWSITGGTPDSKNNYEAIFLPAGTTGEIAITVTAFNVAGNGVPNSGDGTDQDFALVCYNCAELPAFTLSVMPGSQSICTVSETQAVYQVSVGSILGYNSAVTLSATGQPGGSSVSFGSNPVTPAGSSTLTVGNIGADLSGSHVLAVKGESVDSTRTASAVLDLNGSSPGKPVLQNPANGSEDQPVLPAFSWTAASQAASYEIQIATDSQFTNIVDSSAGIAGASYVPPADLQSGRKYYWRVRAKNACGEGAFSVVFSFTIEALPGDCPVGDEPSVLYQTDFEAGPAGWSHSGTGDTWALSSARPHSGTSAFFGKDVSTVSDQYLVSPQMSLPVNQAPLSLQFWNYQAIERNSLGSLCFDGAILEISTDGGSSWWQMAADNLLIDPYHAPVSGTFGNPLAGKDAWCGDPQDWINSVVALDDYAGQAVRFRFRLATDNSTAREGWYIDDVVVQSCQAVGVDSFYFFLPLVGRANPVPD
ncbi:MAG TPA: S8 family serine peptidase, partial [Anaerolineales bacterium]